jgi:hypothetical protein
MKIRSDEVEGDIAVRASYGPGVGFEVRARDRKADDPLHLITRLCMRAARVKDTTLLAKKFAGCASYVPKKYAMNRARPDDEIITTA